MSNYSNYKILKPKPLGSGGNADVFLAQNGKNEEVALKRLKIKDKYFEEKRKRFCIESNLVQSIQDEVTGIIPIYDSGLPDGKDKKLYWYTMPLAVPLSKKINKNSEIREIVQCIIDLANVMDVLHKRKIVHRDIKPSNIYFYNNGFCFGDFGLVDYPEKDDLTKLHEAVGPKATIAPEMKNNAKYSDGKKADVYSLAKTLWMLLTDNKYGFEGTYDESSKLMGLSNYYKDMHLVELEEVLYYATREEPDLRPSMQEFAEKLNEWMNIQANFQKSNLSQWKYVQKKLFGEIIPDRASWSSIEDVVNVLNLLGRMPNLNHMFIPSGGGIDLESIEIASESGCIALKESGTSIVKPKRLIAENISKDYEWSYFRLELDELEPVFGDVIYDLEEVTEDVPGHYVRWICGNYGHYDDGAPLPENYRIVSRYIKGSFVIFLKTSIYNKIDGTYDARHNKMNADEFREYVKGLRKLYNKKSYLKFMEIANISPIEDEEDKEFEKMDKEIEESIKTDNYIKDNLQSWNFSSLLERPEKDDISKLEFSIMFSHSSLNMTHYYLNNEGKLIEDDYFNKEYSKYYHLYNREKAFELIDKCIYYVKMKSKEAGISYNCDEVTFSIHILKIGKPMHMFTKQEIEDVLRRGNDHQNNYMVIDEDGFVKLLNKNKYAVTYPVRFEGFCAYNNYVGEYSKLLHLNDIYRMALEGWLSYLSNNKSVYADYTRDEYTEEKLADQIRKYY